MAFKQGSSKAACPSSLLKNWGPSLQISPSVPCIWGIFCHQMASLLEIQGWNWNRSVSLKSAGNDKVAWNFKCWKENESPPLKTYILHLAKLSLTMKETTTFSQKNYVEGAHQCNCLEQGFLKWRKKPIQV